jgi:ribose-phosphate pyrophosphokinase
MKNNNLVLFAGRSSELLADDIAYNLGIPLGKANNKPFPNGEMSIKIDTNVRNKDVFIVNSICRLRNPDTENYGGCCNDTFVELMLWIDALARASAKRITAVIPYFGYARQDRKSSGRTPISAKVVTTSLETLGCNRVLALDLHAEQIQGFFSHRTILDHLNAGKLLVDWVHSLNLDNPAILSVDLGNVKKVDKYLNGMPKDMSVAVVHKRRLENGQVESVNVIGNIKDKSVIMLDDIISTGGSLYSGIKIANEAGAKEYYIGATHGEFVGEAAKRLKNPLIREIAITDSIPAIKEMKELPITTLKSGVLFAEAIKRIHTGQSLRELLGVFA